MTTAARALRKEFAESSIKAMENGSYIFNNKTYPLLYSSDNTHLYGSSDLSKWSSSRVPSKPPQTTPRISILEMSTIEAAQLLSQPDSNATASINESATQSTLVVGILNFASAKNPGGGFRSGAQAQEESIARSSTLYQSLTSPRASEFYSSHKKDPRGGYYSHAMIFSSNVTVFRNDDGGWIEPFEVSIVTSPAVNAGIVRNHTSAAFAAQEEERIERVMKERMARILFLFESRGVSKLVLGSFGTGVFQNSVSMVARIWAELLGVPGSRFAGSFKTVMFGIIGKKTFDEFKCAFNETCSSRPTTTE